MALRVNCGGPRASRIPTSYGRSVALSVGSAASVATDLLTVGRPTLTPFSMSMVVWDNAVVGIEEGTLVRVEDDVVTVRGRGRVKVFARGEAPRWFTDGERVLI